jgi:hypothetical protein
MFKANNQMEFDSWENLFEGRKLEKYKKSWEYLFYREIFNNIDENDFMVIYSKEASRPNSPINSMVGALILLTAFEWTYEELSDNIDFNVLTRLALGLFDIQSTPFSIATLFNFQNRVMDYQINTGIDLFENMFRKLTASQLEQFKVKANIQRTDSFMVSSNIRRYSRLQLLVEVILRFYKILDDKEKNCFGVKFESYLKYKTSGHFVYNVKKDQITHEIDKIGKLYKEMIEEYCKKYEKTVEYKNLKRVYDEHFKENKDEVNPIDDQQLKSGNLQSPDDTSATYRKKNDKKHYGRLISLIETANPKNNFNLITDVKTAANNKSDNEILNERIEIVKTLTPKLKELHADAGYGSKSNDILLDKENIQMVQTAIKGRECDRTIEIERGVGRNVYYANCPYQSVKGFSNGKKYVAEFDREKCLNCDKKECLMARNKYSNHQYLFDKSDYLMQKRIKIIDKLPKKRKKIRANVEATVREFCGMKTDGKLKVRGNFKTSVFAFLGAVAINFGRIYRNLTQLDEKNGKISSFFHKIFEKLFKLFFNPRLEDSGLKKSVIFC